MATRTKTVEYAFDPLTGSYSEGTTYTDSPDLTVYLPETASRTFVSVQLHVNLHDNHTSPAADLSALSVRASCDAGVTWTTKTRGETLADTGENISWHAVADITAEFTARFGSGTSGTCRYGFYADYSAVAPVLTNVSAKLVITYSYDDVAEATDKRLKTVKIPLDGSLDRLTTTLANIGNANQIPALDTFLPESGKVYRDIFFEITTNVSPAATTDTALGFRLDSDTEVTTAVIEFGSQSPIGLVYRWKKTDMTTNATHTFQARGVAAAICAPFSVTLVVTYEIDEGDTRAGANRMLVSLDLMLMMSSQYIAGGIGDRTVGTLDILVPEANPTLVQSGVLLCLTTGGGTVSVSIHNKGGSTATQFQTRGQSSMAGPVWLAHRTDGGATARVTTDAWTLVRGQNSLTVTLYGAVASCTVGHPRAYLNYTCDMPTALEGGHDAATHNAFVLRTSFDVNGGSQNNADYTGACLSPSDLAYRTAQNYTMGYSAAAANSQDVSALVAEAFTAETGLVADTTLEVGRMTYNLTTERGVFYTGLCACAAFKKYPNDPNRPLNPATSRIMRPVHLTSCAHRWMVEELAYSALSWTVTGVVSGYSGDGSGITVDIFRADTDQKVVSVTTTAGGNYSVTLYDPAATYYSVARQDGTKLGRSDDWTVI